MPLTILSVSYALARVGTDAVGGAEHVLALLDESIVAAGHRSLVVAPEGSVSHGTLIATPAEHGPFDDGARVFDFLRGSEAYKYSRGAVDEPVYSASTRVGVPGRIAHAA